MTITHGNWCNILIFHVEIARSLDGRIVWTATIYCSRTLYGAPEGIPVVYLKN